MNTTTNGNATKSQGIKQQSMAALSMAALGVVFGDIGTSPLYAIRECFHGEYAIDVTQENILGVLSLMFWALTLIVSIKYLTFIFMADNRGEGGVLAQTALVKSLTENPTRRRLFLIGLGIFAAGLLYGDSMITPAISVLSAVEGLRILAPSFQDYVIPITLVILALLFFLQQRGTARVGALFGPVILLWFIILAVLGSKHIIDNPSIFAALSPWWGIKFLIREGVHGFTVLGAVFLVVTGAEALYADLGHFGRAPIRRVWFFLVLPALVLNYFGQGAHLLGHPADAHHPFYAMVPSWGVIPMVFLATAATIIASQAVITGVFSLTRQAIQMGYFPRFKVIHTSTGHLGQIYVPQINWIIMIATLGLVLGFQSSSKLAAAYGVAVTSTMLISSMLFYVISRDKWHWNFVGAGLLALMFITIDLAFLSANVSKIFHGAWFPIALGVLTMIIMTTWQRGRELLGQQLSELTTSFASLKHRITEESVTRIKGYALFLSGRPGTVPVALTHNLKHNRVLQQTVVLLNFNFVEFPRVPNQDKLQIEDLGSGFRSIVASYGFMESPSVPKVLALAKGQGLDIPMDQTSFFLGREKLVLSDPPRIARWRAHLFFFLSRNAHDASDYFEIPHEQIMEVGVRLGL